MEGLLQIATVDTPTPLTVRLKGKTTPVPVLTGPLPVPGDLAQGQRVAVAFIEGQVWFYGRKP